MIPLLWRANLNYLRHHPWQLALAGIGIALGIAIVTAVQVMQASARDEFLAAQRALIGNTTAQVVPTLHDFDEAVYRQLSLQFPDLSLRPILEGDVELATTPRVWLHLIGTDLLSAGTAGTALAQARTLVNELLDPSPSALVSPQIFSALPAVVEHRYPLVDSSLSLRLIAISNSRSRLTEGTALVDIATAQEVLRKPGRISRIDIAQFDNALPLPLFSHLAANLQTTVALQNVVDTLDTQQNLTHAFDLNLTALSLLSVLIGMFLIYNTEHFLIVQRRTFFARLRALGITRREILLSVLVEAGTIGLVASVIGAMLGIFLAHTLLHLVNQTVNDLYYAVAIRNLSLSWLLLGAIAIGGIGATVIASIPAAREASRATPASSFRDPFPQRNLKSAFTFALACVVCIGFLALGTKVNLMRDFAELTLGLVAIACVVPNLLSPCANLLRNLIPPKTPLIRQVGLLIVGRYSLRAGIAMTSLGVAAAVSLGMQLMTHSFRSAVESWLQQLLRADIYVSQVSTAKNTALEQRLHALRNALAHDTRIVATSAVTRQIVGTTPAINVLIYDLPPPARKAFLFVDGEQSTIWSTWDAKDTVILSEPFALKHQLTVGMNLKLTTPLGDKMFEITGVYRDYASEQGVVAMSAARYQRYWPNEGYRALGIYIAPGASPLDVVSHLHQLMPASSGIRIALNAEIKQRSLEVFDNTFRITHLLGLFAIAVSLAGMVSALLAQQLERVHDYGTLRALGARRGELALIVVSQSIFIALLAALIAVPLGIAIAAFLVYVLNVHSFGWVMALEISPRTIAIGELEILAAALVASIYPIFHAVRLQPALILRNE